MLLFFKNTHSPQWPKSVAVGLPAALNTCTCLRRSGLLSGTRANAYMKRPAL